MIKGTQNFPEKSALKAAILIIVVTLRLFPLFFSEDTYTRIKKFSFFLVSKSFFFTINICWISLNFSPIAFEKFLYFFVCAWSDFCYFLMLNQSFSSVQFSSVTQSCLTLCDPMNHSTPGLPVCHQLPEFTQTHVHRVSSAIQLSHPLSSPSPPAPNPSQHQGLFQWVNSLHQVAKVLEFQL